MSAQIDVLAVMARDAASAFEARHGDREIQEFLGKESDAARAAVAELIEVAEWADRMISQHARNEDGQTLDTSSLRDALARAKGA